MQTRPLGLQILWWLEVVVGLRALLFFAPVLLTSRQGQVVSPYDMEGWFLWVATFSSLVYLMVGIASLLGHKLWRFFHVAAMLSVIVLTLALWNSGRQGPAMALPPVYWFPAVWAIVLTMGAYGLRDNPQQA